MRLCILYDCAQHCEDTTGIKLCYMNIDLLWLCCCRQYPGNGPAEDQQGRCGQEMHVQHGGGQRWSWGCSSSRRHGPVRSDFSLIFSDVSCYIHAVGATGGVTVSMSAFLTCLQCYCVGLSLAWGLNLRAVVCGVFWSSLPGVSPGTPVSSPPSIGLMVLPIK